MQSGSCHTNLTKYLSSRMRKSHWSASIMLLNNEVIWAFRKRRWAIFLPLCSTTPVSLPQQVGRDLDNGVHTTQGFCKKKVTAWKINVHRLESALHIISLLVSFPPGDFYNYKVVNSQFFDCKSFILKNTSPLIAPETSLGKVKN